MTKNIFEAVKNNEINVVKELLRSGIDINTIGLDGYTPLMIAVTNRDNEMIKLLLGAGANFNTHTANLDKLSFCTKCGDKVPPYEPSKGTFDLNYPDFFRETDLYYWCSKCNKNLLATNQCDTGTWCKTCSAHMPAFNKFCGNCGARL